jgi:DNA ligase (NAD+)
MNAQTLASQITEARAAYYAGNPTMTDAAFDALEDSLRSLDPNHPVLANVGAAPVSGWAKVQHSIPMGSLNKAQNAADMVKWYCDVGSVFPLLVMEKMDGIAIALRFDKGTLTQAITRGDGITGEDITRNVALMNGIPDASRLGPWSGWVRGEIIVRKSDFAAHFPGESNPRNTAAGTAKRQSDPSKCQHLTVVAFGMTPDVGVLTHKSQEIMGLLGAGFVVPHHHIVDDSSGVQPIYDEYIKTTRKSLDYDIDGLVVVLDKASLWEARGERNNRPLGSIAYKFPHEASSTTLRHIEWQTGPTGRVTPVAVFDAVDLAGASVTRASLHNVSNIRSLTDGVDLGAGSTILVSRRNDVIPYVEAVVSNASSSALVVPHACPDCGTALTTKGEYLLCPNTDGCSAQIMGGIRRWIKKIGVLHFGDRLIETLCDAGMVRDLPDLYTLDPRKVGDLVMDGRQVGGSGDRALASLHAHKELDLATFVGSLGIDLCGRRMVKKLVDAGFTDLSALASAPAATLAAVPGFGEGKAQAFRKGFDARRHTIVGLMANGVTIKPHVAKQATTGGSLSGVSVCFTGVRDKALEAEIVAKGGVVKSGVSKNLSILVCKDPASTSGKAKKARDLGIEIVSLDGMRARVSAAA